MTDNEIENFGKHFGWGLITAFVQWLAAIIVMTLIIVGVADHFRWWMDSTDNRITGQRSHLELLTDYGTGCQYLKNGDAIVPRLNKAGQHICQ